MKKEKERNGLSYEKMMSPYANPRIGVAALLQEMPVAAAALQVEEVADDYEESRFSSNKKRGGFVRYQ